MRYDRPSVRFPNEEEQRFLTSVNSTIISTNKELRLASTGYYIKPIDIHLIDRSKDRDIDHIDVARTLNFLINTKLGLLLYHSESNLVDFKKFIIQYSKDFFIHGTVKKYDDRYTIRFHTVIPYRTNYNMGDDSFHIQINKLVYKGT
jgi:hypothetical protein